MACIGTSAYWTCDVVSDGIPAAPHSPSKEDEPPYHLDGWALLADLVTLYLVTAQRPEIHVVASSSIMRPEAVFLKAPREPVRASHGQQPAACDAGRHQSCCRRHPRSCQTAKTPPNTASAAAAAAPMFFSEVLIRFNCVTEGVAAAQIELTQLDSTQNLAFVLWKRCTSHTTPLPVGQHGGASEDFPSFDTLKCAIPAPLFVNWWNSSLEARPPRLTRFYPLWYSLPTVTGFAPIGCRNKSMAFSPVIPGSSSSAKFVTESSYYAQYASSYYGLTMRKAGYDCLRHYEILASGSIPFHLGIRKLRDQLPLTMYLYPKALIMEAMNLPGIPSEDEVAAAAKKGKMPRLDMQKLDHGRYCTLQARLLTYTRRALTSTALAQYVVRQVQLSRGGLPESPRVLFVLSKNILGATYQQQFLYHGLRRVLGAKMSAWALNTPWITPSGTQHSDGSEVGANPRLIDLYSDFPGDVGRAYGRGFSYYKKLPMPRLYASCGRSRADALLHQARQHRLEAGYFNLIIVAQPMNKCCSLEKCYGLKVLRTLNAYIDRMESVGGFVAVATVDGSDTDVGTDGCHTTFSGELRRVDMHFVREVDPAANPVAANVSKPIPWM